MARARSASGRPRIAIIGGGPAGLSTAFHLTRDPAWQRKIESITVYQMGWRPGGKGATGRHVRDGGARIEEHGIHGFCNFYFNTFRMMDEVYRTLHDDDRALLPLKRMDDAFRGSSTSYSIELINRRWETALSDAPHAPGTPWTDQRKHFGWDEIVRGLIEQIIRRGRRGALGGLDGEDLRPSPAMGATEALAGPLHQQARDAYAAVTTAGAALASDQVSPLLERLAERFEAQRLQRAVLLATAARSGSGPFLRSATTLDFYTALLVGVVREGFWKPDFDLDRLDGIDYRAWLECYGASPVTLSSAIAFAVPNLLFAYPDGDTTRPPTLATASWLNWVLRSVIGRGEYFYFMAAGTGETVVLPLYLNLRRRGVRFEFFHKLTGVRSAPAAASGGVLVEELTFQRQAATKGGTPYAPLVQIGGAHPCAAWPHEPKWDLLVNGDVNKQRRVNYEHWETRRPSGYSTRTLTRGAAGDDGFEHVVWAVPPSIIPEVGDRLMATHWADMTTHLHTTATQAVQVWLTADTAELGWPRHTLKPATARYACATYPNPLNAAVAFDDVIAFEAWGANPPKGLLYLCAQLQMPAGSYSRREHEMRVRQAASGALRLLGAFMRDARPPDPLQRADGFSIDFARLYDPDPLHRGEARLAWQYVRANIGPNDAYVQAQPGTVLGRKEAWGNGYANVVIAGDWIYTGLNLGAFESAVTGGKLAAFGLLGFGGPDDLVGYDFLHAAARARLEQALETKVIPRLR
jgi:uncharacterized protein with NAD-binding domain and iron-sulfur cluster